jgi:hypothetical protein
MCATYFHVTVATFVVIMVLVHVDWGGHHMHKAVHKVVLGGAWMASLYCWY